MVILGSFGAEIFRLTLTGARQITLTGGRQLILTGGRQLILYTTPDNNELPYISL